MMDARELLRRLVLTSPDGHSPMFTSLLGAMGFDRLVWVRVEGSTLVAWVSRSESDRALVDRLIDEIGGTAREARDGGGDPGWLWRWRAPIDAVEPSCVVTFKIGERVLAEAVTRYQLRMARR